MLDAFLDEEVGSPPTPLRSAAFQAPGSTGIQEEDDEDEYGDIEWADEPDVEETQVESPSGQSLPSNAERTAAAKKAAACDAAEISAPGSATTPDNLSAAWKAQSKKDEVRRQARRRSFELRRQAALQHRILALCFATRLRSFNSACDDQLMQSMLLSLIGGRSSPQKDAAVGKLMQDSMLSQTASSEPANLSSKSRWQQLEQQLDRLLSRGGVKPLKEQIEATKAMPSSARFALIYTLLGHRAASPEYRALLLVAFCRSAGIPARIVMLLPLPVASACGKLLEGYELPSSPIWAEVFDESSRHWLPVFGHSSVDVSAVVEPARLARAPWLLAVGEGGQLYDATRRYCKRWTAVLASRGSLARGWDGIIAGLGIDGDKGDINCYMPGSRLAASAAAASLRADIMDERALAKKALFEPLPASRAGFKRHANYVLESQLRQHEVVYPATAKPVGLFQGKDKVWRRSDVTELRTAAQWQREGRKPRKDERAQKMLRGGSVFAMSLYGVWQTELLPVPEQVCMEDGQHERIPGVNSFGNFELLDAGAADRLPAGLIHVGDDLAEKVAVGLRITFAPAVVGFTRDRGGQAKPRYGGVVLWDSDEDALRQGIVKEAERLEVVAEEKQNQRLASAWQLLVKSVLVDRYVEERYRTSQ